MSARDRLVELLAEPPVDRAGPEPWLDLVDGRPGSRGRIQDVWESGGGALWYDGLLAAGDATEGWVPDLLGGASVRAFYRVADRLGLSGGETVLDLACGPGTLTRRLSTAVGPQGLVVASDLSIPMLSRATRAIRSPNVAFLRADAMDLPLRDDTVDAVCCSLCLHLVPDVDTALNGIARVLRPGGRVALAVPAHGSGLGRRLTETLSRVAQARLFDAGELAAALSRRGFGEVRERETRGLQLVDAAAPH